MPDAFGYRLCFQQDRTRRWFAYSHHYRRRTWNVKPPVVGKFCVDGARLVRVISQGLAALGFSKSVDNLRAAVAVYVAWYNMCRVHLSLRVSGAIL